MGQKRLNIVKHSTITQDNGSYVATFDLFGATGSGTTEEEAMRSLAQNVNELLSSNEAAMKEFEAFVDLHGEEVDITAGISPDAKEAAKAVRGVNKEEFDSIISGEIPVLVDFWAEWCKPCFMVAPAVRDLKNELEGRVEVVKVNIDDERELAERYDVKSIPTLMFFKNGKEELRIIGAQPKTELDRQLSAVL